MTVKFRSPLVNNFNCPNIAIPKKIVVMLTNKSNTKIACCLFMLIAFMALGKASYAQKYAYVDTQYILDNVPEYKAANQQLDQLSIQWQKEIEDKYAAIDKLYKAYQAEQILLTEE